MPAYDGKLILCKDLDFATVGNKRSLATADIHNWAEDPVRKGGHPRPLWFEITVTTAFTSGEGNNTLQPIVQNCATAGGTFKSVLLGPVIKKADLTVGQRILLPLPHFGVDDNDSFLPDGMERHVRVFFQQGGTGTDWTAGKLTVILKGG